MCRGAARQPVCPRRRISDVTCLNVITQAIVFAMSDIVLVILAIVTLGYSRPRRAAADARLGAHDRRRAALPDHQLGAGDHPGLAIIFTALGLALLADGLADLLRPE